MGCDWSKTAQGSVNDLHDAPYSLLSVTVEEGRANKNKMSPAGKKRYVATALSLSLCALLFHLSSAPLC